MKKQCLISVIVLASAGIMGCSKNGPPAAGATGGAAEAAPVAGASTTPAAPASQGMSFKLRWPAVGRCVYRMDLEQKSTTKLPQMPKPMEQTMEMGLTYALRVAKETPGGGRELEVEFMAQEMDVKMGGQTVASFDSKESTTADAQNPVAVIFRKMIGTRLRCQADASGKVERLLNLEEWRVKVTGDGADGSRIIFEQIYDEGQLRQLADLGLVFPDKPVLVGETWPVTRDIRAGMVGKITLNLKNTLRGLEDHEGQRCAAIDSTGTMFSVPDGEPGPMGPMKIEEGKVAGSQWFDPVSGVLKDSVANQTMRIKGALPGGNGAEFTTEVVQKVTMKLVEQQPK